MKHTIRVERENWVMRWDGNRIFVNDPRVGQAAFYALWVTIMLSIPVVLPLDVILKKLGRRGFFIRSPNSIQYQLDYHAFKKVKP